jgi:hypothetical protein
MVFRGNSQIFTIDNAVIIGDDNEINGENCLVKGNRNVIYGHFCAIEGHENTIFGDNCKIISGNFNIINGKACEITSGYGNECINQQSKDESKDWPFWDAYPTVVPSVEPILFCPLIEDQRYGETSRRIRMPSETQDSSSENVCSLPHNSFCPIHGWNTRNGLSSFQEGLLEVVSSHITTSIRTESTKKKETSPPMVNGPEIPKIVKDTPTDKWTLEQDACITCCANLKCTTCMDCGHVMMCNGCTRTFMVDGKNKTCPLCNVPIKKGFLQLYNK